jgi:hypothetical protein
MKDLIRIVKLRNEFFTKLRFLINCKDLKDSNDLTIFENESLRRSDGFEKISILAFCYFIVETKNKIQLLTFEYHTKTACNKFQLILINEFQKSTETWRDNPLTLEKKFQNFHKCPIAITGSPNGYMLDFISSIIAQIGNGKLTTNLDLATWFFITPNTGFSLYPFPSGQPLTAYDFDSQIFVVSKGEKYTNFEKVLLPFDAETWTYLILTLSGTFLIIFVLNFTPRNVQNMIYGTNIKITAFYVIGTFFG